jgi:uncharacterized membrane protein
MKSKLTWLETVLVAAPFLTLALFWGKLPARVPMHWDWHGQIDRWDARMPGLLVAPLTALATVVLLRILPWFDPKLRRNADAPGRMTTALPIIRLAVVVLLDGVFYVQIAVSLGQQIDGGRILLIGILLCFAIMGNYLGALRPNYFAGVRTPWTLENPETWRATHRLGGRLLFFGSFILLVLQFFLSMSTFGLFFVVSILALVAWGMLYSWHHYRTRMAHRSES